MKNIFIKQISKQSGLAMPTALFLVMTIGIVSAIFTRVSTEGIKIVKLSEASTDTFQISEGVAHDLLRQMSVLPHLWRQKTNLANVPAAYTGYSPLSYTSTNGIPSCTGASCLRNLYPSSGGLIKNFGPIGAAGDTADTTKSVVNQLDLTTLPTEDVTLNGQKAWVQVERLDETSPGASTIGGELSNNSGNGNTSNAIRFRITGTTLRKVKERNGKSTVVLVAELPSS